MLKRGKLTLEDIGSFLAKLAEQSESVYWLSSPDFDKIQYISPAFEKIWGRPREILYSQPELWINYLFPEDAKEHHPINAMAERIAKLGSDARYEENYRIIRPDGEIRWIIDRGFPIYDDEGNCCGVTGVAVDVTKEKQAEEALRKAKEELEVSKEKAETANRAKTEFIQNMSHDIRTPLAGVIGAANMLEKSAQTKDEQNTAHMIHASGQRLLDLLNGVLDVISAENINDADLHKETFDLLERIQVLRDLILPIVKTKEIHLVFDIDPHVPRYIITDRLKIERILLNLLGNAIKFTEHGQVNLHVKVLAHDKDHVHLEFSVTDTGIGIPKGKINQVFDRFFRVNPSFKGIHQGHGIGLYIVKKYVNLLGGEVHVSSEEEKSTTFHFALLMKTGKAKDAVAITPGEFSDPAILNLTETKTPQPAAKTKVLHGAKGAVNVLYIEDDAIASHVGANMLHSMGCTVQAAPDAETALQLFKTRHFDLVVSDVGLPGMSGNELAALIRLWEKSNDKTPVPIVALTGHAIGQASDECILAGMNKVFDKPLTEEKARGMLKEFCESPKQKKVIKEKSRVAKKRSTKKTSVSKPAIVSQKSSPARVGLLGADLPDTEEQLFQLEQYPLFDMKEGVTVLGNEEEVKNVLSLFVEKAISNEEIAAFHTARANQDWEKVAAITHKLKGACIYCGISRMRYACQYVERYYKAGHRKLLEELCKQFLTVLDQTKKYVINWLKANK